MREKLIQLMKAYYPVNDQECVDKELILNLLQTQEDIFLRTNQTAHMTASAWVVNYDRSQVLMVYHNIYDSWSWLGGHADGDKDLLAVAIREVQEESGIQNVNAVSEDIFSLEILTVDGHEKKGEYVPSHLHLNVTYLLEANEKELLRIKADENSGASWFAAEECVEKSSEPWFRERIYPKLLSKCKTYRNLDPLP